MKDPLGASYFDSAFPVGSANRSEADRYWEFPFCNCDGQEAPFNQRGYVCDECKREIAVKVPVPEVDRA